MNKLSLIILVFLLISGCSSKDDSYIQEDVRVKIILSKELLEEQEFNTGVEISISNGVYNDNFDSNQNDQGELSYEGLFQKVGKYSYSKFDNFKYVDAQPVFYNEKLIFFDKKGSIILYNKDQEVIWKKNFYNKNEKKLFPKLNFANSNNTLIITDSIAKYYSVDVDTGEIIWSKSNTVPFNSDIKINKDVFFVVDFSNILRCISIKDGSEIWKFKTEESSTRSNTKISIVTDNENIYFNNSIGDITAVNLNTGKLTWQLPTQNNIINKNAFQLSSSKIVLNDNSLYFSNNKNEFYSIDKQTGLINWKNEINSNLKPIVVEKFIITVSNKGYLYLIEKKTGNIVRINDLFFNYREIKRKKVFATGFFVAMKKIYVTNTDGKLIVVNLNTGDILNTIKIARGKILRPFIDKNKLFLIQNGSIIKYN